MTGLAAKTNRVVSKKITAIALLVVIFVALTAAVYTFLPVQVDWTVHGSYSIGADWKGAFRPGILRMLAFENPYGHAEPFFNPPWVYLPLIPVALLSPALGSAVMYVLSWFGFGTAAYRMGAKPLALVMLLLLPQVLGNCANGNLDWVVALGCTLPPQIGLFLVLAKPQIGAGVALFWLVEAWRAGKLPRIIRVFWPVTAAYLLSFLVFGLWPLHSTGMANDPYNASLFPLSLPFGIALLVAALRTRNLSFAILSTPLMSPYVNHTSWSIAIFALIPYQAEFIVSWLAMTALQVRWFY